MRKVNSGARSHTRTVNLDATTPDVSDTILELVFGLMLHLSILILLFTLLSVRGVE